MYKACIKIKQNLENGFTKHDCPYHTNGKMTKEEALKRVTQAFKKMGLSQENYEIIIYESLI